MRLREIFEAAPAQKVVAVMPGGFHPFHPGHKSLYDWAVETFGRENVYVAATNDTTTRPFPFDVKIKLAQMAGVPANRFIQVKSPFNALSYNDIIGDASQTALVFVRSEKDKTSHPLPDQVRKSDGNMGYLISYTGDDNLETADTHGYLAYGPTIDFDFSGMSIKSASELRAAWPEMSDEDKLQAAELMYPGNGQTATQLLDQALGVKDEVPAESIEEDISSWVQSLQHTGSDQKSKLPKNKQNAINSLGRIQQFEKPADIVQAALNVYGLSPEEVIAALPQDFDPSRRTNHSQATKDRMAAIDRHALEDASSDEEDEFHRKLDKLVHKTFGHSSDEKKMKKKYSESESDTYYIVTVHSGGTVKRYKFDGDKFADSNEAAEFVSKFFEDKGLSVRVSVQQYRKKKISEEQSVELPDGSTKDINPDGSYTLSSGKGKEYFDKNGKLIKTQSPTINGLTTIKYPSGKGRYIYSAGGAEVRGPLDGDKPGESDYMSYSFAGTRFIFDARNGQPQISGSIEIGRLRVELTGKVLDRPAFHKNPNMVMTQVLGGDPMAVLNDPMAVKPMLDAGTAKIYLDGKEASVEQLAQAVEQGL